MIAQIQEARDRAQKAKDPKAAWVATINEMTLRWKAAGEPDVEPPDEVQLMMNICNALRRGKDRSAAFCRIEEWRDAWLQALRQRDLTSSARLNVIDSFRRAKGEIE